MKSNVKRTQRNYSLAFKLPVVDQLEKTEITYKQAQERYGKDKNGNTLWS